MKGISYCLFVILILQFATDSKAQSPSVKFYPVAIHETFNAGAITGITQDFNGKMWFATRQAGIISYDGNKFDNYTVEANNSRTLSKVWVESICASRDGKIWIGTFGNGLDVLDPSTRIVTHFRHNTNDPNSIAHSIVSVLHEDRQGILWVGTYDGLDRIDRKTGKFTHFKHDPQDPSTISNNQIKVIFEDRNGDLWIGTGSPWLSGEVPGEAGVAGEGGLNKLDKKTGKFTRYMHDVNNPNSLAENKVRSIFEDSRGNFWIGTTGENGLQLLDRATGKFRSFPYDPTHPGQLARPPYNKNIAFDQVTFINEDASGAIWIGTMGNGMNRYDPVSKQVVNYNGKDTATGFSQPVPGNFSFHGMAWPG